MADQLAAASLGCYGSPVKATPNLDRLASEGVRFDRHYSVHPVCGPARAAIFSGRTSTATGVFYNNLPHRPGLVYFPQLLRSAGYRTGGFGKFHFHAMQSPLPEDLADFGFDEVRQTEDPKTGPWLEWIRSEYPGEYERALSLVWPRAYFSEAQKSEWKSAWEKHLVPKMKPPFNQLAFLSPLPAELHQNRWISNHAIRFLERQSRSDKPFFAAVSFVAPHDPYDPPESYARNFNPKDIPPPIPREWEGDFASVTYLQNRGPLRFPALGGKLLKEYSSDEWARLRAHYFASLKFVDDEIGRILTALVQNGLNENTIVVFTTDHGDMIGDHSLLTKGAHHYDKSIRSPLLIRNPFKPADAGSVCSQLTSLVDFFPTFCGWAGCGLQGVFLEGHSFDRQNDREELLVSFGSPMLDRNTHSLITREGLRYSIFPGQRYGELFNLRDDPDEQRNLYTEKSRTHERGELAQRLARALAQSIHGGYRDIKVME